MVNKISNEGGNVVSLLDRLVDMAFPEISEMQSYWNRLRGSRALPLRSEVDPRAIENCLEYAFILERIAPGLARFRLAGSHLNDLIGMEVRGMPLSAIFSPEAREALSDHVETVFAEPAVVEIELNAERGIGKAPMDGRLLLMPLKSDFGDVTRILGCLVTRGPIGRTPRRFRISRAQVTPVSAIDPDPRRAADGPQDGPAPDSVQDNRRKDSVPFARAPRPADRGPIDPSPLPRAVDGFGEAGAGFDSAAPRPPRGKPKLYIIRDNDPSD